MNEPAILVALKTLYNGRCLFKPTVTRTHHFQILIYSSFYSESLSKSSKWQRNTAVESGKRQRCPQ